MMIIVTTISQADMLAKVATNSIGKGNFLYKSHAKLRVRCLPFLEFQLTILSKKSQGKKLLSHGLQKLQNLPFLVGSRYADKKFHPGCVIGHHDISNLIGHNSSNIIVQYKYNPIQLCPSQDWNSEKLQMFQVTSCKTIIVFSSRWAG